MGFRFSWQPLCVPVRGHPIPWCWCCLHRCSCGIRHVGQHDHPSTMLDRASITYPSWPSRLCRRDHGRGGLSKRVAGPAHDPVACAAVLDMRHHLQRDLCRSMDAPWRSRGPGRPAAAHDGRSGLKPRPCGRRLASGAHPWPITAFQLHPAGSDHQRPVHHQTVHDRPTSSSALADGGLVLHRAHRWL